MPKKLREEIHITVETDDGRLPEAIAQVAAVNLTRGLSLKLGNVEEVRRIDVSPPDTRKRINAEIRD